MIMASMRSDGIECGRNKITVEIPSDACRTEGVGADAGAYAYARMQGYVSDVENAGDYRINIWTYIQHRLTISDVLFILKVIKLF